MIKVFTSYQRETSGMLASLIREKLKHHKVDAFVDTYDMIPGPFPAHLHSEIEASEAFLCLLADTTLESNWVNQELEHAYRSNKTLIPVFQESYTPPTVKPEHIQALLSSNGITILDRRNLYIDEAITKLAEFIKSVNKQLKSKRVRIQVTLDLSTVDISRFLIFVSGITLTGINLITLISQHLGSIILTLEMPEEAANRLIRLIRETPELVAEFRVKNIEHIGFEPTQQEKTKLATITVIEDNHTQVSPPIKQDLFFSAYAPKEILPEVWQPFYAYVYRESSAKIVLADVTTLLEDNLSTYRLTQQNGQTQSLKAGTIITATPFVPGLQFNPPSAALGFWENWHRFNFSVRAKDTTSSQVANGIVTFAVEGIIVADIPLSVVVDKTESNKIAVSPVAATLYQKVFASYSRFDRVIVERIEKAFRSLGFDYLRDVTSIKSGSNWTEALLNLIDSADIFQLFWSRSAAKDNYVKQEWSYGLKYEAERSHFIRPVYWQKTIPPPPPELAHLHFAYFPDLTS